MKCMVYFCLVLFVLTVVSAKKNKQNNEEKEKSLKKIFKECQKNEATRVDSTVLKKIRKQKQVEIPENFGDHKLCIVKGLGILNGDDTINLENLKKRVTKKAKDDQDIDSIVTECGVAQQDPKSSALHIEKCLLKNGVDL